MEKTRKCSSPKEDGFPNETLVRISNWFSLISIRAIVLCSLLLCFLPVVFFDTSVFSRSVSNLHGPSTSVQAWEIQHNGSDEYYLLSRLPKPCVRDRGKWSCQLYRWYLLVPHRSVQSCRTERCLLELGLWTLCVFFVVGCWRGSGEAFRLSELRKISCAERLLNYSVLYAFLFAVSPIASFLVLTTVWLKWATWLSFPQLERKTVVDVGFERVICAEYVVAMLPKCMIQNKSTVLTYKNSSSFLPPDF